MSSYTYPANTITFGGRDSLPVGNPDKLLSGVAFDTEFISVQNGKLDKNGNDFEGNISSALATIDGGTF